MTKKNNINERTLLLSDISIKRPVFAAVVSLDTGNIWIILNEGPSDQRVP